MLHKILGWIIGISIISLGLVFILGKTIFGLLLIMVGITFVPLFRDWLRKKTKRNISFKSRQILYSVFGMILVAVLINTLITEKNIANKKLQEEQSINLEKEIQRKAEILKRKLEEFKNNKDIILTKITEFKNDKNYSAGLTLANNYTFTNDEDVLILKKEIQTIQKNIQKKVETRAILSKLKKLPSSRYEDNYDLYLKLTKLHPANKTYKEKVEYYGKKISNKIAKERLKEAYYGSKPVASNWDGSYRAVERYLDIIAKDPDSIKIHSCSEVFKSKSGWLVKCSYRGKNSFGGVVLNANWFTIRNGNVVNIESSDSYSF